MSWIKEFSKSVSNLFKGQVLEGFQPIDFYHFLPQWYDLWIHKIAQVIKKLDLESRHYNEIKELLPPPSNMRVILVKMIPAYYANPADNKTDFKIVSNFLARMLEESCPQDPFALHANPYHTESEIAKIMDDVKWTTADVPSARKVGQLITAAGSLVHGLYNDLVTDLGWEAYGPYKIINEENLLIRHFPNLRPTELWPNEFLSDVKEIMIYSVYEKDVEWEISFVGCHTISQGKSPIHGMKKYAVYADDKLLTPEEIQNLIIELSSKATDLYKHIRQLDFEELKLLVMKQECYQLKTLFDEAGIDWLPDKQMMMRIKDKELMKNIFPHGKLIETTEEFENIFGINKFEKEVLKNN